MQVTEDRRFQLGVFVSYSHSHLDQAVVEAFTSTVKRRLPWARVYRDVTDVPAGAPLIGEIFRACIALAHVCVVFVSRQSLASKYVHQEVALATAFGKVILPVVLEPGLPLNLGFIDLDGIAYEARTPGEPLHRLFGRTLKALNHWQGCFAIEASVHRHLSSPTFEKDEDRFYSFARGVVDRQSGYVVFKAGTPALLLRDEAYTPNRVDYRDALLRTYTRKASLTKGLYLFDYRKTRTALADTEGDERRRFARRVLRTIDTNRLDAAAVRPRRFLRYLPSGILGERRGCIILRSPVTGRFEGLAFVAGRQAAQLHQFYLSLAAPENRIAYGDWVPQMMAA